MRDRSVARWPALAWPGPPRAKYAKSRARVAVLAIVSCALGRLVALPANKLGYRIKKRRNGRSKLRVMTPVELMAPLAALVAPPRHPWSDFTAPSRRARHGAARLIPKRPIVHTGGKRTSEPSAMSNFTNTPNARRLFVPSCPRVPRRRPSPRHRSPIKARSEIEVLQLESIRGAGSRTSSTCSR